MISWTSKNKTKIIAAVVIAALLAAAWFIGGNTNKGGEPPNASAQDTLTAPNSTGESVAPHSPALTPAPVSAPGSPDTINAGHEAPDSPDREDPREDPREGPSGPDTPRTPGAPETTGGDPIDPETPSAAPGTPTEPQSPPQSPSPPPSPSPLQSPPPSPSPEQTDDLIIDPAPDDIQGPDDPDEPGDGDGSFTVTLTIRCNTLLNNMNLLRSEKHELVPADGVIFAEKAVTAYEGETVFNVLQREMMRARMHMAFRSTPLYNSAYIEAINNLYEFDAGELSGWIYRVNGWFPNYGCSRYQLQPGDAIEFLYSCQLGLDLGGYDLGGWQTDE